MGNQASVINHGFAYQFAGCAVARRGPAAAGDTKVGNPERFKFEVSSFGQIQFVELAWFAPRLRPKRFFFA